MFRANFFILTSFSASGCVELEIILLFSTFQVLNLFLYLETKFE
jgi:hypothetical protein